MRSQWLQKTSAVVLSLVMAATLIPSIPKAQRVSAAEGKELVVENEDGVDISYTILTEDTVQGTGTVQIGYDGWSATNDQDVEELSLPDTVVSYGITYTVTAIGDGAFNSYYNLALTSLPKNITSIGAEAFIACENLALTSLPNGVTSIGNDAFSGCSSLALTSLPVGVTNIGEGAFADCSSLSISTWPKVIDTISPYVFQGCSSITSFEVPKRVTSIGEYAFYSSGIKSITLLEGIENIENNAFDTCEQLESIEIPTSVTSVGKYAFVGCKSLKTITLPCTKKDIINGKGITVDKVNNTYTVKGTTPAAEGKLVLKHGDSELKGAEDATYEKDGYTGDQCCVECGDVVEKGTVIPKLIKPTEATTTATSTTTTTATTKPTTPTKVSITKAIAAKVKATTYTGYKKKPSVTVTYNGKKLKKGTDYTVSYKNNTKVGTAKVIIKGKGNYTGTKTVTFKIKKRTKVAKGIYTVKSGGLYGRKGPAKAKRITMVLKKGDKVTVTKLSKKVGKYRWVQIKKNGKSAYVFSKYLK